MAPKTIHPLFPQYLNQGSKGGAATLLQLLLQSKFPDAGVLADGDYGQKTADAVKRLQAELNVEQDGNFGPQTRAKWKENGGPDIDGITVAKFRRQNVGAEAPTT